MSDASTDTASGARTEPTSTAPSVKESAPAPPTGPVKTPFLAPYDGIKPPAPAKLTSEQETKYDNVLKTVSSWKEIPDTLEKNSKLSPITDDERMFLTRECLLRYLRATKWNAAEASKRLMNTLTWRRDYGVDKHTADYISPENETGKQVIAGYDNDARPCLYLNPAKQNTKKSDRQIQHLVFMLERVIDMMVPGQDTTALLINFKESTSGSNPSVGQGRQTLHILQTHYPERLGRAFVINIPWPVWTFFKLISPFIDPLTREKLKFNEGIRQYVPPAQLLTTHGGDAQFEYDHSIYWPTLNKIAAERRAAYRERWVKAGRRVGEHETYLRGGDEPCLVEIEKAKVAPAPPAAEPLTNIVSA
ncbi:pleiotropic drug resistance protein [Xylona heveae TC161]|uniref:Pleiotropic drug resistance protein n=1 Tax=Xylona heveae (strain CBS 132557 / TC161) TaxID=1328760 RepID=A0A165JUJ6_XYLHT|nr:pleiotropic drug resistance protein [Xylona heveae TC161]KZF26647.1 pleiotropic drug resistance protein [Xylona heveae TC161]